SRRRAHGRPGEHDRIWRSEVRMVQSVKEFSPELYVHALSNRRVLDQREIHRLKTWAAQGSSSQVAPSPNGRQRKGSRIEPLRLFFQQYRAIERRIQVRPVRIPGVSVTRPVGANLRSEGEAAQ